MKDVVVSTNRKEEFRSIATQNFTRELQTFAQRMAL